VFSGGGEAVPLLLDEPLLSADPVRRTSALQFLWELSATQQMVISTCDPTLVSELDAVCDSDAVSIVIMPTAAATLETTGRVVAAVARQL
jgi:energy-coupling factor transporter ATP-binding protein EcfA2